jgi:TorA maturation chaperone TorD
MSPRRGAAVVLPQEARSLTADAAMLRLVGLLFERPRHGWADEVRSLAAQQPDQELAEAARRAPGATEGDYHRIFGPGGSVSPREVAYQGFADPGRILADLTALYGAFAFRPRAEDPIDHIAVETGFAGYLAMKEAYAVTRGDRVGTERTRQARTLFLKNHLRPFAAGLAQRLSAAGAPAHLQTAQCVLFRWAGCDLPGSGIAASAPPVEEPVMTCGACGDAESCGEGAAPGWIADPRRRR